MEQQFQIGVIASTHGLKGEVKVYPTTDDRERFKKLKQVILDTGREQRLLKVQHVKFVKQMVVLKFREFNDINEVEQYKGKSLLVNREDAVPLEAGEYYVADLIGLTAKTEEGEVLGIVRDVIETGANDVYVIAGEEGGELLVPAIKECVLDIDFENNCMQLHLLDGLR